MVTDFASGRFIAVFCGKGRPHDLQLFRQSQVHFKESVLGLADKGYQGIRHRHDSAALLLSVSPRRNLYRCPISSRIEP